MLDLSSEKTDHSGPGSAVHPRSRATPAAGATFARTIRQIKNYTTTAIISRAADAARNLTNPRADALPNTLQISQNSPAHLALTGKLDKT